MMKKKKKKKKTPYMEGVELDGSRTDTLATDGAPTEQTTENADADSIDTLADKLDEGL